MDLLVDIVIDALKDTLNLVPFLLITYAALEAFEQFASHKVAHAVKQAGGAGPIVGALLGIVPQCGFSAVAATLYANRLVSLGTLVAVFLSTSDEMLPLLVAEQVSPDIMLRILGSKAVIALIFGFIVDAVMRLLGKHSLDDAAELDIHHHVHAHSDNALKSIVLGAIRHTLEVSLFVFVITVALNAVLELVGTQVLGSLFSANELLSVALCALFGFIPNCAASVVITQLYLEGVLTTGPMLAGSLAGAGAGMLVLFRSNENPRENIRILCLLYILAIFVGFIVVAAGI